MVSGTSTLNTGLKTSREEFPASEGCISKWGTRGPRVLAQSWVKLRQRQKTGDSRPTGFGGLTTPPNGCHSVKAPFVLGNVSTGVGGRLQQTTNRLGVAMPAFSRAAREAEAGGEGGDLRSPRAAWSPRRVPGLAGRPLRGGKKPNPNPAAPRADGPSLPGMFLEAGGELQPPGSPQCPPHLPRAAGQAFGADRQGERRTLEKPPVPHTARAAERSEEGFGRPDSRRHQRRGRAPPTYPRRLPPWPASTRGPSGHDFSGETAAARVLSPPAERRPAKTDSHGRRSPKPVLSSGT